MTTHNAIRNTKYDIRNTINMQYKPNLQENQVNANSVLAKGYEADIVFWPKNPKANFLNGKMNISYAITKNYENARLRGREKTKPNSKPIKPNTKPIQTQYKPNQSQFKPKTNPIKLADPPVAGQFRPPSKPPLLPIAHSQN